MTGELNETQINNILCSQAVGRIACCDGKHPYIVPVTYSYDGEHIFAQSYEGRKMEMMRKNPNVCFQVDISTDIFNWQSVLIFGQFEEIDEDEIPETRESHFSKIMPLMTGSRIHEHEHSERSDNTLSDTSRIKPIMFRININEKMGRFEKR
jgi:nitroimidazol reductase NimA-like FMN-containing flavoprotein (pyridoxamine 5'-phosphate oxidase superfamily)